MIHIMPALMNFVRPTPHSKFSPSSADRWLACPYSIGATVGIPEERSVYSDEGTFAHSVCEAVFREEYFLVPFPAELKQEIQMWEMGDIMKRGGAFEEMMDCARGYVDVISYYLRNKELMGDIVWFGLEKGVPIYPAKGCFGTGDCIIIGTKAAAVIDYKHGKGKNVSGNSIQLKVYALGLYLHLQNIPTDYLFHACVYQPRTDMAPKEHSYTLQDMQSFSTTVMDAILRSEAAELEPVEGNHCFWCPANRTKDPALKCKAIKEKPIKIANENFAKFLADMNAPAKKWGESDEKRDQAIIKIMGLFPLMKKIVEDCTAEFEQRLLQGEAIPGVRMVESMGNRTYNAETPEQAAKLIKEKFPQVEPVKEIPATTKLKTLTEIEKEYKIKLDSVCVRKVTKKVDILDEKMADILGEMHAYGTMINNDGQ